MQIAISAKLQPRYANLHMLSILATFLHYSFRFFHADTLILFTPSYSSASGLQLSVSQSCNREARLLHRSGNSKSHSPHPPADFWQEDKYLPAKENYYRSTFPSFSVVGWVLYIVPLPLHLTSSSLLALRLEMSRWGHNLPFWRCMKWELICDMIATKVQA